MLEITQGKQWCEDMYARQDTVLYHNNVHAADVIWLRSMKSWNQITLWDFLMVDVKFAPVPHNRGDPMCPCIATAVWLRSLFWSPEYPCPPTWCHRSWHGHLPQGLAVSLLRKYVMGVRLRYGDWRCRPAFHQGHDGRTNSYHVNVCDDIALTYNDPGSHLNNVSLKILGMLVLAQFHASPSLPVLDGYKLAKDISVLENMHISKTFKLMHSVLAPASASYSSVQLHCLHTFKLPFDLMQSADVFEDPSTNILVTWNGWIRKSCEDF